MHLWSWLPPQGTQRPAEGRRSPSELVNGMDPLSRPSGGWSRGARETPPSFFAVASTVIHCACLKWGWNAVRLRVGGTSMSTPQRGKEVLYLTQQDVVQAG